MFMALLKYLATGYQYSSRVEWLVKMDWSKWTGLKWMNQRCYKGI